MFRAVPGGLVKKAGRLMQNGFSARDPACGKGSTEPGTGAEEKRQRFAFWEAEGPSLFQSAGRLLSPFPGWESPDALP